MFKFVTYKFYTDRKERLAIFYVDNKIEVIKCSKNDIFTKKKAKTLYNDPKAKRYHIEDIHLDTIDELIQWASKMYPRYSYFPAPGIKDVKLVNDTIEILRYENRIQ